MTLLLVLICFVAFFTLVMWARFVIFPPKDTGTIGNDVRYRCLASIIYLIMLNIWQIIFFAYYYSAATSKEKGDGHFPDSSLPVPPLDSQLLLLRTIDRGDQHCQLGVECRILLSTRMGDNTSRPNIIGEFRSGTEQQQPRNLHRVHRFTLYLRLFVGCNLRLINLLPFAHFIERVSSPHEHCLEAPRWMPSIGGLASAAEPCPAFATRFWSSANYRGGKLDEGRDANQHCEASFRDSPRNRNAEHCLGADWQLIPSSRAGARRSFGYARICLRLFTDESHGQKFAGVCAGKRGGAKTLEPILEHRRRD